MKILLGTIFSALMTTASLAITTTTSVPFQNIILNPSNTIQASYSFGVEPMIFCFTNSLQTVGNITWPHKGKTNASTLPITLITNGNYQGSFADSTGTLFITNTTGTTIIVSCPFAL